MTTLDQEPQMVQMHFKEEGMSGLWKEMADDWEEG